MTEPAAPDPAVPPAPVDGSAEQGVPASRAKPRAPRSRSAAAAEPAKGAPTGDATPTPAPRAKRPSASAARSRSTAAGGTTTRPKRAAAAQSSPDTVRPPRRGTAAAADAAVEGTPAEEEATTTRLLPAVHPVADPDPDGKTTEILPPVTPAPPPDEDDTTELLAPAVPAPEPADPPTELLQPVAAPPTGPAMIPLGEAPPARVQPRAEERPEPRAAPAEAPASEPNGPETVLRVRGLSKRFGTTLAVDRLDLDVQAGSFAGIVGPNGAGKTTTLSMVTGLLRPDVGTVEVHGIDVWQDPERAKRAIGVLPDALRLFDRLTGAQLLHYSGVLRGLDAATVRQRSADLVQAFGLEDATGRMVADYSAGMTKKIALAAAMIHSPRLLVLDEPFESVDPVSAANIIEILQNYVASGGTVVLSSHGMDLIQRVCDHVAIVVRGRVLAAGTTDEVRAGRSLEDRFVELAGGRKAAKGMEWLHSFTD